MQPSPTSSPQPTSAASTATDNILIVDHITQTFGGVRAVDDASLTVRRGSITALIGPNGAGKSTMVNIISGFYPAQHGTVVFDGHEIAGKSPHVVAQRGLIRTFQISRDYSNMTVLENLMAVAPNQVGDSLFNIFFRPGAVKADERRHLEKAIDILTTFGLYEKRNDYAGNLSGGQKRLLEMSRALMAEPKMLLLDEPMAGVNPALAEQLAEHILNLSHQGITFLMIEHNLGIVDRICEEAIVMADGRPLARGPMEQIRQNQEVVEAYLGGV